MKCKLKGRDLCSKGGREVGHGFGREVGREVGVNLAWIFFQGWREFGVDFWLQKYREFAATSSCFVQVKHPLVPIWVVLPCVFSSF